MVDMLLKLIDKLFVFADWCISILGWLDDHVFEYLWKALFRRRTQKENLYHRILSYKIKTPEFEKAVRKVRVTFGDNFHVLTALDGFYVAYNSHPEKVAEKLHRLGLEMLKVLNTSSN